MRTDHAMPGLWMFRASQGGNTLGALPLKEVVVGSMDDR